MSQNLNGAVALIGIDIGKNSFHTLTLQGSNSQRCKAWSSVGRAAGPVSGLILT